MTTTYAPPEGMGLEPRFRRDLARKPSKHCSRYIARLLAELDQIETALHHWGELDVSTRKRFHAIVIGAPPPRRTLSERYKAFLDDVNMSVAIWFHREEVYQYFARSHAVAELLYEKVGEDVWAETLASPEDVAAIARGREDAIAGRTFDLADT
jgi:hypothetical protein